MPILRTFRPTTVAASLVLALALAGCNGVATNRSLYSVHQPEVSRSTLTLDLATGPHGLAAGEANRLAGWFEALGLGYGDRLALDDPMASGLTRAAVDAVAARRGVLLGGDVPATAGAIAPGRVRVVIERSRASVPGCPDWHANTDFNPNNALSTNYGCATNSNLAAMVANPEDLVRGRGPSDVIVSMRNAKVVEAYREKPPTSTEELQQEGVK